MAGLGRPCWIVSTKLISLKLLETTGEATGKNVAPTPNPLPLILSEFQACTHLINRYILRRNGEEICHASVDEGGEKSSDWLVSGPAYSAVRRIGTRRKVGAECVSAGEKGEKG